MLQTVQCAKCGKNFQRPIRRYNEAIKFGWKQYCSKKCQCEAKNKQIIFICSRPGCGKSFKRIKRDFLKYGVSYCSHRCFALVSNKESPRWLWKIKKCTICGKEFRRNKKYCSSECQHRAQMTDKKIFFNEINDFVKLENRIPFKREFMHYSAVRRNFGTWNNFVELAGFETNPVLFAKKYIAKDGHKCDSLSEKIIDDWLFRRKIKHKRSFPYPSDDKFTVDFKVDNYWIEFFGLAGLKKYDEVKKRKVKLAKTLKIKLIKIYPKDLFPKVHIEDKLKFLM